MLAYVATKDQFLQDAPSIEEIVRDAVASSLGINIARTSAEFNSWRNSLGNAMYHVINSSGIPSDSGIAIEYRLHGRQQRIDFIVSGSNATGLSQLVLVELKQWSSVTASPLEDHVRTFLGGAIHDVTHPSYQSWSYARLLKDFYEVVESEPIEIAPCAYLHNCLDGSAMTTQSCADMLSRAPLFLHSNRHELSRFLKDRIASGDKSAIIRRIEASQIRPSKPFVEVLESMLRGNEEFVLIDEQKTAYETIRERVKCVKKGKRLVLVIKGGPGTGKSVIAINALVSLLSEGLNVRYVTKNAAPRAVYQQKLRGRMTTAAVSNLFMSSDSFHAIEPDSYDVLLVDEAHRLVQKSGFYKNLGDNQISEIIKSSRVTVFFSDDSQLVTWRDIGTFDEIRSRAEAHETPVEEIQLSAQFRCAGSAEYLAWIDTVLGLTTNQSPNLSLCEYDIRVVESPNELRELILERNKSNNRSRLLAGYCWPWVSKNDSSAFDITFPQTDFAMKWNLTSDGSGWMIASNSVHEVGCIHTCQGLEGDYFGVIIGPDLAAEDGVLVGRPENRAPHDKSLQGFKSAKKINEKQARAKADRLIRNTYRTLMTRGMLGTFIYCTDPAVAALVRKSLTTCGYNTAPDRNVS